jgi:hypothetical protein
VVVHNLNHEGVGALPHKAETARIVDTDAVLPFAVRHERFKMVSTRNRQVEKTGGPMENGKLLQGHAADAGWNSAGLPRLPKQQGIGVVEAPDRPKS